jgi:hypothetical protein
MSRPTPRPWVPVVIVLFLFVAVLSPTPAIGASWTDRESAAFDRFMNSIAAIWAEAGCEYDPNGLCRERQSVQAEPGSRLVTANEGCGYDPSGRCGSGLAVERETGCGYDPNGRCQP